uniref:Uncharacterized protein n=1 Tax=Timema poppense TaxID=170557 RepID=A0A7R9D456_TIMPO|nr:unnamed protein product [Timema poppensis]
MRIKSPNSSIVAVGTFLQLRAQASIGRNCYNFVKVLLLLAPRWAPSSLSLSLVMVSSKTCVSRDPCDWRSNEGKVSFGDEEELNIWLKMWRGKRGSPTWGRSVCSFLSSLGISGLSCYGCVVGVHFRSNGRRRREDLPECFVGAERRGGRETMPECFVDGSLLVDLVDDDAKIIPSYSQLLQYSSFSRTDLSILFLAPGTKDKAVYQDLNNDGSPVPDM